ncbi:class I adenylate-forming enzyme family protein [Hoylesella shahii]|uniref:class I adenylate-forming enzyme family protein n=1 Tax=Hoylesella shahii TaxID=228603 RepID=UPI001E51BC24|nr:fatty acid--CoA ligase family protein [Hoylesella shahii]
MISTQAIAATAENIIHAQAYRPDITFIIPGQLNHLGCLSKVFATLAMGATCHLMPKLDLNELFAISAQCKDMAAAAFLVPSCIRMLTHFGGKQMEGLANKMAFIETGGDALDAATMADIHALLPNTRLFNTYASTETGVVSTFEFTHEHVAGCVGKALPHTHFDITPEGHIRCWGRSLMSGYLRMGEQTTFEPLADGRFTTCDWGEIDEQGALHFKCRNSDIINTGGFKVSPQEVESVANSFPEVKACVCIAVPHPILAGTKVARGTQQPHAHSAQRFGTPTKSTFRNPSSATLLRASGRFSTYSQWQNQSQMVRQ